MENPFISIAIYAPLMSIISVMKTVLLVELSVYISSSWPFRCAHIEQYDCVCGRCVLRKKGIHNIHSHEPKWTVSWSERKRYKVCACACACAWNRWVCRFFKVLYFFMFVFVLWVSIFHSGCAPSLVGCRRRRRRTSHGEMINATHYTMFLVYWLDPLNADRTRIHHTHRLICAWLMLMFIHTHTHTNTNSLFSHFLLVVYIYWKLVCWLCSSTALCFVGRRSFRVRKMHC